MSTLDTTREKILMDNLLETPTIKKDRALWHLIMHLWSYLSRRRQRQFGWLLGLTLLSSVTEVVSLGAVVPFIGILTQPEQVFANPTIASIVHSLGILTAKDLVLPLTIAFSLAALLAGAVRLLLLWASIRLSNAAGVDLGIEVYRRTLYQSYSVHVARSSSEIISGITQKVGTVTSVLISLISVATAFCLLAAIFITLIAVNPMVASIAIASFGTCYGLIAWKTRYRLLRNSKCIAQEQTHVVKALQEGLGAIRDVILDGTQPVYCDVYRKAMQRLQIANVQNSYINQAPRFTLEALGMVLIAALALFLSYKPGGVGAALPILGTLALGAQRLLPLLHQLYGNWSVIIGNQASLVDVLGLLDQPLPEETTSSICEPLKFSRAIEFVNVKFQYGGKGSYVLNGFNLTIPKGSRIGFIGSTGSGKSTALDLLMRLLDPTEGEILVDGRAISPSLKRAWQGTIAHVPQNIFLSDATIAENIAFGVPIDEIDMSRVRKAAEQAHISQFIEERPEGYQAVVGERGVRLSGGQRQRIGIARALYKNASVLVFDEATSALDSATESDVMSAIESLDRHLTVLIIAHRITTLKHCDLIVRLERGQIANQGPYEMFV